MAKSRSTRGASHQPDFMSSCLTICQACLPCPPSGWIRLNVRAWWRREKCLWGNRKGDYIQGQSWTVVVASKNCEICDIILICRMVVVTSNFHCGSPGLPQNWGVKTTRKRNHEFVCRWRQLTLAD